MAKKKKTRKKSKNKASVKVNPEAVTTEPAVKETLEPAVEETPEPILDAGVGTHLSSFQWNAVRAEGQQHEVHYKLLEIVSTANASLEFFWADSEHKRAPAVQLEAPGPPRP